MDYARSLKRDLKSEREHRLTLVAKLQRLELEKRSHMEDISELSALLAAARRDAEASKQQLAEAEQQARQLQATVDALAAELQVRGGCRGLLRGQQQQQQQPAAPVGGRRREPAVEPQAAQKPQLQAHSRSRPCPRRRRPRRGGAAARTRSGGPPWCPATWRCCRGAGQRGPGQRPLHQPFS